jgi:transposase
LKPNAIYTALKRIRDQKKKEAGTCPCCGHALN